jgi:hypothetical protein
MTTERPNRPVRSISAATGSPEAIDRLKELRSGLLRLHKALLDFERSSYERFHGRVESSGQLLQLVIQDDWFAWLRLISQLVIQIDEVLSGEEPVTSDAAQTLVAQTRTLLNPSEEGTAFEKRYHHALQNDPDAILLHAKLSNLLN